MDPSFDPAKLARPYFKKKLTKSRKETQETAENETESNEWLERVQVVSLSKIAEKDPKMFTKITDETIEMFAAGKIEPCPSAIYSLKEVNKAIKFVYGKKSLVKVLVNMKRT